VREQHFLLNILYGDITFQLGFPEETDQCDELTGDIEA